MLIVNDYAINRRTMALLSQNSDKYKTKILEPDKIIYCTKTSSQLIREACLDGASTYNGRKEAMEKMLRTKSKLPIPINPANGVFFFPNMSPKEPHCDWFSFFHVLEYVKYKEDKSKTKIMFVNNTFEIVDTSYPSITRQFCLTGLAVALVYRRVFWYGEESPTT